MVTARRRGRGPKTGEGSKVGGTCNSLPQPSGNPRDGIVRVVFPPGMLLTSAAAAGDADDFLTRQVTRLGSSRAPRGATRSGRRCVGYPPHGARAVLGPDYFEIRLPPTCAQQTAAGRGRGSGQGRDAASCASRACPKTRRWWCQHVGGSQATVQLRDPACEKSLGASELRSQNADP